MINSVDNNKPNDPPEGYFSQNTKEYLITAAKISVVALTSVALFTAALYVGAAALPVLATGSLLWNSGNAAALLYFAGGISIMGAAAGLGISSAQMIFEGREPPPTLYGANYIDYDPDDDYSNHSLMYKTTDQNWKDCLNFLGKGVKISLKNSLIGAVALPIIFCPPFWGPGCLIGSCYFVHCCIPPM